MRNAGNCRLAERFIEYCRREQGRSPQTVYKYALSIDDLLVHLGPVRLVDASVDDLRVWVHRPTVKGRTGRPVGSEPAPATVKRKVAELRSLYRWLHEVEGVVPRNTARALAAPTVHNEAPRPADVDAWRALWASGLSDSDRVAFGFGFFCGLRRHEVTLLSAGHVVDVPQPRLVGFKRKGGKKANLPWLSCVRMFGERRPDLIGGDVSTFCSALQRLRVARAGRVTLVDWAESTRRPGNWKYAAPEGFVDPFQFNRRLKRALVAADLPGGVFTPHQLRHSFCTHLLDMGVPLLDVSRLANHSSVTVTQRYIQTREDPLEALLGAADRSDSLSAPSPWM